MLDKLAGRVAMTLIRMSSYGPGSSRTSSRRGNCKLRIVDSEGGQPPMCVPFDKLGLFVTENLGFSFTIG
jgi:hypothetical protein